MRTRMNRGSEHDKIELHPLLLRLPDLLNIFVPDVHSALAASIPQLPPLGKLLVLFDDESSN